MYEHIHIYTFLRVMSIFEIILVLVKRRKKKEVEKDCV